MTIAEIEQAIAQLSPQEFKRLREWFEEYTKPGYGMSKSSAT